jgi:Holliday junction resolvase RusA-like endonuclease
MAKVIDALNGIVWRDDSQVVSLTVEKFYSARPRLELTACEL